MTTVKPPAANQRGRHLTIRIPPLTPDEMTGRQRALHDEITASRSGQSLRGPFAVWLRNPDLAARANEFGGLLRHGTSVPVRLVELAVMVTARHWSAEYPWCAHYRHAVARGIDEAVLQAIAERRPPEFSDDDDALVYTLASELYETRALSDETYGLALARFGEATLIELVTICGFYSMIGMTVAAFGSPLPDGAVAPFPD